MNILITGGAGFIGRATARELVAQGHEVLIVDNLQERVHPTGWPVEVIANFKHEFGDVRDINMWRRMLPDVDAVLHLAAYQDYMNDYSTFFNVNASGTALLYEVAKATGWRGQVVVASSSSTLGEGAYRCVTCSSRIIGAKRDWVAVRKGDYDMRCDHCKQPTVATWTYEEEAWPITPYGVSKLTEELIALRLGDMLDIPSVGMRYSIVQGPGQSPFNAYSGVMRATALQILAGWKSIVLFEDGNQLRDYVSIHDVVNANVLALSGALPNDGYHVGGGRDWSVRELASALVRISESSASITTPGLARIGDVRHTLSATKRLKSFGWSADASKTIETSTWEPYFEWLARMNLDAEAIVGPAFANMRKSGVLIEVGS